MSKRGLPSAVQMRHDFHYVEELSKSQRTIGRVISVDKIDPNPEQPRVELGDLGELVESIKYKGVLEPLLVKPIKTSQRWLIIAGERRWRAAQLAGLTEVPCIELDVDDAEVAEIALIENLQRKDLTVWEESDALAALSQRYNYTHDEIARKIGKSRSSVTESLTVAALPRVVRERCRTLELNGKSIILQVARQFDENAMNAFLDKIVSSRLTAVNVANDDDETNDETTETLTSGKSAKVTPNENDSRDKAKGINPNVAKTIQPANYPVKNFNFISENSDSRLSLKFKKPVDKENLINFLRSVIDELQS